MLDKLLDWIERRGGKREIIRDGKPYLTRYYVWRSKYLTVLIHKIWASDPDDVHDHPWDNASLILRGWYAEYDKYGEHQNRYPRDFVLRKADALHRLVVRPESSCPVITMFFTGKRKRSWGFLTKNGWISAKVYERQKVDIEGKDFVIKGHLFPRVVWIT